MRLPALLAAVLVSLAAPAAVAAQETEAPSSRPPPEPGAPPPPVAAPREASAAPATGPDRSAARAAVRTQCVDDRARLCRGPGDGDACLSSHFAKLGADCQAAVTSLRQSQAERGGGV